jgi:hypothetical protein
MRDIAELGSYSFKRSPAENIGICHSISEKDYAFSVVLSYKYAVIIMQERSRREREQRCLLMYAYWYAFSLHHLMEWTQIMILLSSCLTDWQVWLVFIQRY